MICVLKNLDDLVYAYIEFQICDKDGFVCNDGEFTYISDIWIHPSHERTDCVAMLAREVNQHPFTLQTKYVYWNREKYNFRQVKPIEKVKLLRRLGINEIF